MCATLGPAPGQRLIDRTKQLLVGEDLIDLAHPVLSQLADFLGDQPLGKVQLSAAGFDHARPYALLFIAFMRCFSRPSARNSCSRFLAAIAEPISRNRTHAAWALLIAGPSCGGT